MAGIVCEVGFTSSFFTTWIFLTVLAFIMIMIMSGALFYKSYVNPTFEMWKMKSNPQYPEPRMVRDEVLTMMKGMCSASLCPALTLYLSKIGYSKGYCGSNDKSFMHHVGQFVFIVLVSDFLEFYYHRLGHTVKACWNVHRAHHVFFNPSPFAVIADEYVDQFFRASLLLILPLIMPINMDIMFFTYAGFFYLYGIYLHWGYESNWPDAHHPWINTAYQHYCHHARSIYNKPYHTGFFLKIWDQMFDSVWPDDRCDCVKCDAKAGNRTMEKFKAVVVPDYSVLLQPSYWMPGGPDAAGKKAG